MSLSIPTEAILNGGYAFQKLAPSAMYLRTFYFSQSGIPSPGLLSGLQSRDLIQVCPETCEIVISRDNLLYAYFKIEPDLFTETVGGFVAEVFKVLKE